MSNYRRVGIREDTACVLYNPVGNLINIAVGIDENRMETRRSQCTKDRRSMTIIESVPFGSLRIVVSVGPEICSVTNCLVVETPRERCLQNKDNCVIRVNTPVELFMHLCFGAIEAVAIEVDLPHCNTTSILGASYGNHEFVRDQFAIPFRLCTHSSELRVSFQLGTDEITVRNTEEPMLTVFPNLSDFDARSSFTNEGRTESEQMMSRMFIDFRHTIIDRVDFTVAGNFLALKTRRTAG